MLSLPLVLDHANAFLFEKGINVVAFNSISAESKCPVGAKFKKCATPCPKTCANYNKIEPCLKPCVPACQCKSGLVLHEKQCIEPDKCPTR